MLHSAQAHPAQSDLVLQLRKQCFYFPALALRCRESRNGRPLSCPLSRRFVDMDRNLPIVAPGALRFLRAVATALPRSHIHMRSIYGIDANVGEPLSFRTLIAVRLGNVGELLDPVQVGFGSRTFFHANIRSDASLLEPSQKLTVPIGRVGGNRLWKVPASFR